VHPATKDPGHEPARGTIVAAIPARFGSTRLPGKPLLPIAGRPMIEHVVERVRRAEGLDRVVVLTDDRRIAAAVEGFGGEVEMTPPECRSGTDRIAWAARRWPEAAALVNVQGDEPLIDPADVSAVARHLAEHPGDPVVTLAVAAEAEDFEAPSAVKVVTDRAGYALYFSRSRIPFPRHGNAPAARPRKHVGMYGYQREALLALADLPTSPLEEAEGLEQLRALENGVRIRVLQGSAPAFGVDTPEDLAKVERMIKDRERG
jgi:3-deoxy-manno-octulosonate cytidylyltransferase (CMP-KDO synthetase)